MTPTHPFPSRRRLLTQIGAGAAALTIARLFEPGVFADELEKRRRTPAMTEGPFYPDHLPLDTDNDLLIVNDSLTPAVGDVTHLTGRVLDGRGNPVRNATVEIWQCDHSGAYLHSHGSPTGKRDPNFQGYGRFMTSSTGEYYFRTIKPVPYPGRTPHIHFKVNVQGRNQLTTQCFINGEPRNDKDGIYRHVDSKLRDLVNVDFKPIKDSKIGELAANFDMLLGYTPEG
jgi:protocatechuate 3,4-dioxygenase beta subunit